MGLTLEKQFNKLFSTKIESTTLPQKRRGRVIPTKNTSNYGFVCVTHLRWLCTVFTLYVLEDAT